MKNPELLSPGFSLTLITNLNLIYEKKLICFYITNIEYGNAKRIELKLMKLKRLLVYFAFFRHSVPLKKKKLKLEEDFASFFLINWYNRKIPNREVRDFL